MPIYEYQCKKCNHVFDVDIDYDERKDIEPCPECGEDAKYQFIPSRTFKLKGGGWPSKSIRADG